MDGSFSGASTGSQSAWRHCNAKGSSEWVCCQAFANRNKRQHSNTWLTASVSLVHMLMLKLSNCHCQRNCGVLQLGNRHLAAGSWQLAAGGWRLEAGSKRRRAGHRPTLLALHPSCTPHYPLLPLAKCLPAQHVPMDMSYSQSAASMRVSSSAPDLSMSHR